MESTKVSFEELKKKKKIYTSYRSLAEQHFKLINFLCFIAMITPLIIVFVKNVMVQN